MGQQCEINFDSVKSGIIDKAKDMLDGGVHMDEINKQFGEEVVKSLPVEGLDAKIEPSDTLVNFYINDYKLRNDVDDTGSSVSDNYKGYDMSIKTDSPEFGIVRKKDDYYTVLPSKAFEGKTKILNSIGVKQGKRGYYYVLNSDESKYIETYLRKSRNASIGGTGIGFELKGGENENVYLKNINGKQYLFVDLIHYVDDDGVFLPKVYGKIKLKVDVLYPKEVESYLNSTEKDTPFIPEHERELKKHLFKTLGISPAKAANYYLYNIKDEILKFLNKEGENVDYSFFNLENNISILKDKLDLSKKIDEIREKYTDIVENMSTTDLRSEVMNLLIDNYSEKDLEGIWSIINNLPDSFLRLISFEYVNSETAFFMGADEKNKEASHDVSNILNKKGLIPAMATNVAIRGMKDDGLLSDEDLEDINEIIRQRFNLAVNLNRKLKLKNVYDLSRSSLKKWNAIEVHGTTKYKGKATDLFSTFLDYHRKATYSITEYVGRQNKGLADIVKLIENSRIQKVNKVWTNVTIGNFDNYNGKFKVDYPVIAAHELGHALDFYLTSTNPEIGYNIQNFINSLLSIPEFEKYIKDGLESRGYDTNDRKELVADLYAWVMAKSANYDMASSHLKELDKFIEENIEKVENIFKDSFALQTKENKTAETLPTTTEKLGIIQYVRKLLAEMIDWVNEMLGMKSYSINEKSGTIKEEEVVKSIKPLLKMMDRILFRDSNFDIDKILDSSTQESFFNSKILSEGKSKKSYAASTLNEKDLDIFRKLQNAGLISHKSFSFESNGKNVTLYSIPKVRDLSGRVPVFEKDYIKRNKLLSLINKNGWTFFRIRETKNAILIDLGDFSSEPPSIEFRGIPLSEVQQLPTPNKGSLTKQRVLTFLKNIGFTNIQIVKDLIHNGQGLEGNAYIDMIKGVMQIVDGYQEVALPEESMHILVELIAQSAPDLFRSMEKDVVNYKLYSALVNDPEYINDPNYRKNGNIDYDKLKREAMAKLLANFLVNELEGKETNRDRIVKIGSWWNMIIDWVKGLFSKYSNPFKEALARIEQDDKAFGVFKDITSKDLYFQKNPVAKTLEERDEEYSYTRDTFDRIKANALGFTKGLNDKGREVYFKDGVEWQGTRVSDEIKVFYDDLFKSAPPFTDEERLKNAAFAKDGDFVHAVFEDVGKALVDEKTGLLRNNPLALTSSLYEGIFDRRIADRVFNWMQEYLHEYPEGTRFLIETIVADNAKMVAGTIDFMAIVPDVTNKTVKAVDINDWKTKKTLEEVKDYKKEGWTRQINAYKRILTTPSYDIKEFGKLRATPIERVYTKGGILKNVLIGDVNPADEENSRLRPVISDEETTGDKIKDDLISSLGGIYNEFVKLLRAKKIPNRLVLNKLDDAIFELRVSNNVVHLSDYLRQFSAKVQEISRVIDANKSTDLNVINGYLGEVNLYRKLFQGLGEVSNLIIHSANKEDIDRIELNKLRRVYDDTTILMKYLDKSSEGLLIILANENNVFHLTSPEKVVSLIPSLFRAMGDHDVASIRLMFELAKKSYNRIDFEADTELKSLKSLKVKFDSFIKEKGISVEDATAMLVNFEKGSLHSKIDKTFYEERKKAFDSKDARKIAAFVRTNFNLDRWNEWYTAELAAQTRLWESSNNSVDPEESQRLREYNKAQFERTYNVIKNPLTAFNSYNKLVWNKNIKEELWLSEAYKKIESEPVLIEIYNHFLAKNKELSDIGAIKEWETYTFLPNIRKGVADIFSFEDNNFLESSGKALLQGYSNWKNGIKVSDYQMNFLGQVDEITGEKLGKRFVPYVSNLDNYIKLYRDVAQKLGIGNKNEEWEELSKKVTKYRENKANDALFAKEIQKSRQQSFDLFNIYGLMGKEIAKEKYLQEIDEVLRALKHLEENKKNYATNVFGRGNVKNGEYVVANRPGQNAELFTKYYKYLVEGESIQMDNDYAFKFSLKNVWNKTPLGKLHKFDIDDSDKSGVSVTKFVMMLNNFNIKKTLGLNVAAGLSNIFGSTWGTHRLYSNKVSENDLYWAWTQLTSGAFHQSEEMKKNAAFVDYFLPLLNNREAFKSSQLSVNKASTILSQEWLMSTQRKGDELVQLNIFLAHLRNTGLVEGKIVNLRELALSQVKPEDYWKKSPSERKTIDEAVDKRLEGLREQYALAKVAIFKKVEIDGKEETIIEIPGVERTGDQVANFRALIQTMSKDATGGMDEFDMGTFRFSVIGRLAGTFKNWIPRMADVRWSEFHYSQSHNSYEYGRFRMYMRALSANWLASVSKLIPLPYITDAITKNFGKEDFIKRAMEIYQEKRLEAERQGKLDVFMTEDEFISRFLNGVEASFAEVRAFSLLMMVLIFGIMKGDDDDSDEEKSAKKLIRRQIDKMSDEIGFFFNAKSAIDIAASPFPITGLIKDMYSLFGNVTQQTFGFGLHNLGLEETGSDMMEKAKPMKYTFKVLPVLKEILNYIPAFDSQLAKDWGIILTDKRGF